MFGSFNPHELLQNKNCETIMNAVKSKCADEVDFLELIV